MGFFYDGRFPLFSLLGYASSVPFLLCLFVSFCSLASSTKVLFSIAPTFPFFLFPFVSPTPRWMRFFDGSRVSFGSGISIRSSGWVVLLFNSPRFVPRYVKSSTGLKGPRSFSPFNKYSEKQEAWIWQTRCHYAEAFCYSPPVGFWPFAFFLSLHTRWPTGLLLRRICLSYSLLSTRPRIYRSLGRVRYHWEDMT